MEECMLSNPVRAPRRILLLGLVIAGAFALPSVSSSQSEADAVADTAETDMIFTAGEEVIVTQSTSDDIFAAGSMVEARGASGDHLFLAGGDITVSGADVRDVIAAGGEIRLNAASVSDDLIVGGGDIVVGEGFEIGGTAVIAGGKVRFEAPVGQDLRIGASEIFVNSLVPGDARLSGDQIVLGPNARIGGDLFYRGGNLTVDQAAVIEGNRTELPSAENYAAEDFAKGMGQFFLYFSLSMIISYFVIVAVLVAAVPALMRSTSNMLRTNHWQALGIGVLYALIVPVFGLILLWTGLGIPLAVLLFLVSLALTPIAVAVTAHFVGMAARRIVTNKTEPAQSTVERILWPLAGVVILFALALIPIAGLLIVLLAMLFGLGACLKQAFGALGTPPASEAVTA
jgi:cytoskeletal protein CcmA (bactofilin family)